jgi:hypothetical protein
VLYHHKTVSLIEKISHHVEQSGEARRRGFSGEIFFIPSFVLHDERGGVGKSGILVFEQLVERIEIVFQSNHKNASRGFLDIIIIASIIIIIEYEQQRVRGGRSVRERFIRSRGINNFCRVSRRSRARVTLTAIFLATRRGV